jgi:hypothetical protein
VNDERRAQSTTTDGKPPRPGFENASAPAPIRADGQHEAYWVLKPEERAKGWVRPLRQEYEHVGIRPTHAVRDLTADEQERYAAFGYAKFEQYPEGSDTLGRYWTERDLTSGCGAITHMGLALAETYAREPGYYGLTFCVGCSKHRPVGAHGEFVWKGTTERVGT